MKGNLYIVSTPIGNLQDITIRAVLTLASVDYILAEQPQKTGILLSETKKRYPEIARGSSAKILSFNEFEEPLKIPEAIKLLEEGNSLALVSEAGTPLLSDPGFKLVREAHKHNIQIVPIPGVSSITTALSVAALPTDKFLFLGFLPKSQGKKENFLQKLKKVLNTSSENDIAPTIILFESPHRLEETLRSIESILGDIEIVLAHELTKIYESVIKNKLSEHLKRFEKEKPKGEYIILLNLKDQ